MYSSRSDFDQTYQTVKATFASGKSRSVPWRKWQLKQVWWMLDDNEERIISALKKDLNRPAWESHVAELTTLKHDILHTLKNIDDWTRDVKLGGTMLNWLGDATVRKEPLGITLIIGAWNFPFLLLLQPMLAAIAAGCTAVLKPSELSSESQDLLVHIVPKYLDQSAIRVVTAGPAEMGYILEHKFNQIFYTGSPTVAKIVAKAAANHLTPTVLELGGQGPAIVTRSANLDLAAKSVAAAKIMNAGQICLSTNHVFVPQDLQPEFVERLGYWLDKFGAGENERWGNMCRIVNERHFDRVSGLLEKSIGKVVYGGSRDKYQKFIEPTVLLDVTMKDSIMSQELFAPVLPIITAEIDEAISNINSLEHPLAIYIFSSDKKEIKHVIDNTQSGGVTVNDCMLHASVEGAPFGGVGEAGHGYYHGVYGVNAFSHFRTIISPPTWLDKFMGFRYPPYDLQNLKKLGLPSKPHFKRGETLHDQEDVPSNLAYLGAKSMTGVMIRWGFLAAVTYTISAHKDIMKLTKVAFV